MNKEPIDVVFTHVSATRQFKGFLGPFWTIVHCYLARRQEIKLLEQRTKLSAAQAKEIAELTSREVAIAHAKVAALANRCRSDVHQVKHWKAGDSWDITNRYTGALMERYTIMHGRCVHCGSHVSKRHYTFPPKT